MVERPVPLDRLIAVAACRFVNRRAQPSKMLEFIAVEFAQVIKAMGQNFDRDRLLYIG